MKFSYNWIADLVDGLDTRPEELMRLITMKTAECEGIHQSPAGPVIEVDNKSLTHRPDLWGHYGMAREVAVITGRNLRDPADLLLLPSGAPGVEIEISDFALCPRYSALVFDNVTIQPSPSWLQSRLESVGLNPINNIVDVTNYVMAELAQPMHAFDAGRLLGDKILVRSAGSGERITALNGETYEVGPANLLIADVEGPIAIAGVIGGQDSGISEGTRRIVLESACFQATSIRKTSVQLKLRTDASMRFEKSQDPANTVRGLARAISLLEEVSPGIRITGGLADARGEQKPAPSIDLPMAWVGRKLGRDTTDREVRVILEALGFSVADKYDGVLSVTVPSWRATKDISIKDDLLEEIGRIIGYDSITPRAPLVEATPPPANPERAYHRRVRNLTSALGYTEVYNYSFISEDMATEFSLDPAAHLRVLNPIASDQTLMRMSLLPGIRKNLLDNARHLQSFRLFEIGSEIHKSESGSLPSEIPHLVAALYARDDGSAGLFEVKRLAEALMRECITRPAEPRPYEHPQRSAEVIWRGATAGRLFELHPKLIEDGRAAVMDINLSLTQSLDQGDRKFAPLQKFPTSSFDLSVLAPLRQPVAEIQQRLAALAGDELVQIEFVRQYAGAPLPENRKSVSYRLTFGASDRTLSSDEVGAVRARVIEGMRALGYELRV